MDEKQNLRALLQTVETTLFQHQFDLTDRQTTQLSDWLCNALGPQWWYWLTDSDRVPVGLDDGSVKDIYLGYWVNRTDNSRLLPSIVLAINKECIFTDRNHVAPTLPRSVMGFTRDKFI